MLIRIPENTRVENNIVFLGDSMIVVGIVSPLNPNFMEIGTPINVIGQQVQMDENFKETGSGSVFPDINRDAGHP
jgi:predicted acyltransferase (DUF342 family)